MNDTPKISVGLAVYNGEKYLEQAIHSILAQTFSDFELIISDNASTDRTQEICQKFAAQDPRIRYHRNEKNIGGANNENQTFRMARGQYFRWAAHDDVCASELFARCVEVLDRDPSVVLCHTRIIKIDGEGKEFGLLDENLAASDQPNQRFRELYRWTHDCEATYGLIRADVMGKTGLQHNYTDSDRTFLCELCLYGKFHQIREPLFYKRYHETMSTRVFQEYRARMAWFNPDFDPKQGVASPHWMQFFHYLRIIAKTPLPFRERALCYLHMLRWLYFDSRWKWMMLDVLKGVFRTFRSFLKPATT